MSQPSRLRRYLLTTVLIAGFSLCLAAPNAVAALGSIEEISTAEELRADSIQVDIDPGGLATAFWNGQTGSPPSVGIFATTRSDDDADWTTPVSVSGGNSVFYFDSDVGRVGRAVVAWSGPQSVIYAAYRSSAGVWSAPELVKAPELNAYQPNVRTAIDSNGNVVVTWRYENETDAGQSAYARYRSATTDTWSSVDTISGTAVPGGDGLDVIAAGDDSFVAVWYRLGGDYLVGTSTRPAGDASTWSAPRTDLTSETSPTGKPAIASDPQGNVTIVWRQYIPDFSNCPPTCSFSQLWSVKRPVGGDWSPVEVVSGTDIDVAPFELPALESDAMGNLTAVWIDGWDFEQRLRTATKTPAGAWSSPVTIDDDNTAITQLALGVDGVGNSTLLWRSQDAANTYRIELATRAAGGSWSPATTQSATSSPSYAANFPSVAAVGNGGAVAAWNSQVVSDVTPVASFARYSEPLIGPPPVVTITSPVGGSTTENSVTLNFTATDTSGIAPTCNYTDGQSVPIVLGPNTITVTCFDGDGLQHSASVTVTGTVVPDSTPPVVNITAPLNGSTTTASSVALSYTATDDGVTAPTCNPANGAVIPLALGGNTITVSCTDGASNAGSASITVTRIAPPPPVATPPVAGGPTISRASIKPKTVYRKSGKSGSKKKKRATSGKVTFTLSAAATVKLEFRLRTKGRQAKSKCVKQTRSNRRKKSCERLITKSRLTKKIGAGSKSISFKSKKLPKGKYFVFVIAKSTAGVDAKPARVKLTVR